jgi:two-component system response regulator YesN
MLREFEEKAPGYMQVIRSKIIELLIVTMRKIYFTNTDDTENNIDTMLKYISTEYMNDLTLGDICKKFNYSFAYLSAKFKNEVGINFTQYLQKIRIEQSMRLLANTNKTIIEIAQEVGYNDVKAFYMIFKRIANTTPAKFRRSYYRDL